MLADRYRVIGLIGKGGMGEVYKADDTKLGQTVALKFLPDRLEQDATALALFHSEVRTARQVAHPGVCRVFDIGQVEGRHFLSMEFIDGDDLSSLLRRVGRLSSERAIEIARELCIGLSAIHAAGILHRDFKPANVIIDGKGKARITDFGIAGLENDVAQDEMRMGTPAYMSPEQISGRDISPRSDIYALGLVLYEIFTGKQAFSADTVGELVKKHQTEIPTRPSEHVKGLDPLVERIIFQCLEKDPADRPSSALQVALALPGGNPLQVALEAGETPSPEMVAASPKKGALKPAIALVVALAGVAMIVFAAIASMKVAPQNTVLFTKSPEVLSERANEVRAALGYPDQPVESQYRYHYEPTYFDYLGLNSPPEAWAKMSTGQPMIMVFRERQSPQYFDVLLSGNGEWQFESQTKPGMRSIWLDTRGRLVEFSAVPPRYVETSSPGQPDWGAAFAAAGLDPARFTETTPVWTPLVASDTRKAWQGVMPDHPEIPLRIDAAAFQGKIVFFQLNYPWNKPTDTTDRITTARDWAGIAIIATVCIATLLFAIFLAYRNVKAGRGDRKGAFKIALIVLLLYFVGMSLSISHVPAFFPELDRFSHSLRLGLQASAISWLFYLALEPYIRRLWPELIVSWTRLLAGDWRDPLVGRDVLIGTAVGLLHIILIPLGKLLERVVYNDHAVLRLPGNNGLSGVRYLLSDVLLRAGFAILFGFLAICLIVILLMLLRRKKFVVGFVFLIVLALEILFFSHSAIYLGVSIAISLLFTALLTRVGLVAVVVEMIVFSLMASTVFTTNLSAWYASGMLFSVFLIAALLAYGFWISSAGRPLFAAEEKPAVAK